MVTEVKFIHFCKWQRGTFIDSKQSMEYLKYQINNIFTQCGSIKVLVIHIKNNNNIMLAEEYKK